MAGRGRRRTQRQEMLAGYLRTNPFLTDEDLAQVLGVSVQTVRLDRLRLQIPELRERLKQLARGEAEVPRSLAEGELIGELVELVAGLRATSILTVTRDMVLRRTRMARGHYLFAQANSLAVALIDSEVVVTGSARVRFRRPVYYGEKVLARATVGMTRGNKYVVRVTSTVRNDVVMEGRFLVVAMGGEALT
ncbi:MAG: transcription factor FapR [Firmicutes bacterium]|nr:transcription factor FapR [Bacillota bacterium]